MTVNARSRWGLGALALLATLATAAPTAAAPPAPAAAASTAAPAAEKAATAPAPAPKGSATGTPEPIPIPDIANRAEEVSKLLHDLVVLAEPPPAIDTIRARLPEVSARLGPELNATIETLGSDPPLPIVERMIMSWQASRRDLAEAADGLTRRATDLEGALQRLQRLREQWTETRVAAQASHVPTAVLQRVDGVLGDVDVTRTQLQAQRAATLVLQDVVGQELARCQEALDRTAEYRQGALTRTLVRSTLPIWSPDVRTHQIRELPARAREAAVASLNVLRAFATANAGGLVVQAMLFLAVVLAARGVRRQALAAVAAGTPAPPVTALHAQPVSSAAVIALASMSWLYPERPQTVVDLAGMLLLVPVVRIVRPHLAPAAVPLLYGFAALCLVDRVRAELAVIPVADQALLLLVMLAVIAGLVWLLASGPPRGGGARDPIAPAWFPVRFTAGLALLASLASFAAAAYGTMRLARVLGAGLMVGLFMAFVAFCAAQVSFGLVAFARRVSPLRRLRMVQRHGDLIERRLRLLIGTAAALTWVVGTLRFHGVLDVSLALGRSALGVELRQGTIGISLADVLAFGMTVWLAFLLSAVIRFVLEEDVYPRLPLSPGIPQVISSLLNYVILLVGFLLAMGALGVDLSRVTVLAGAIGVGLGFGLQGLVNNFVSGLIVLFERPLRVGDAIQMAGLEGEVRQIGIRSTIVRTWDGADVIVPNGTVVSEKVTNWTRSDRQRRIDVPVGVAYGTAPEKILELLLSVAHAHPHVLAVPAPVALFHGFGDSALNFELRAWTGRFERALAIRSELGVAVYTALSDAGIEIPFPQREVRLHH